MGGPKVQTLLQLERKNHALNVSIAALRRTRESSEWLRGFSMESSGSAGTDSRNSIRPVLRITENRMPAKAAARGVFKHARIKLTSSFMTSSKENS
jgi:hypothetical protein